MKAWSRSAHRRLGRRRARLACWLASGALLMLVVAGCGSSDNKAATASAGGANASADAKGVTEAKQIVADAMKPEKWVSPGPSFDASAARGKTVWYIAVAYNVPILQTLKKNLEEGLASVGANVKVFDAAGSPANFGRGIDQAIAAKADAIVLAGIPSTEAAPQVESARKAQIPVITAQTHDESLPLPDEPQGVFGEVTFCYSCVGRLLAAWTVADTDGKLNGLVFTSSSTGLTSRLEGDNIISETKRLCPSCKVQARDTSVPQWSTRLPTLTQSEVQSDPKINYVIPLYDAMSLFVVPAIHQANAANRTKVISFNATPAVMKLLAKEDVVGADLGGNTPWQGWGIADMTLRALNGQKPVKSENVPLRLFTRENVKSLDLNADESTWYGDVDFKSEYKKLWGVK
jgi:ribose transport system substrate-binding protein